MHRLLFAFAIFFSLISPAPGQPAAMSDPLLERLSGTWVLRGTIAGKDRTHDVTAEWILGRQYLRLHEVSREKDGQGRSEYEAVVLIGWDVAAAEYQCLWLDSTGGGGLSAEGIAHGKRNGDAVPFLFKARDGSLSFNNTFSYDKEKDSWAWQMDNIQDGKPDPFGRVRLTRQ